jgi:uncharacterized membrane protein YdjX (TVP38/TMEM64 family)
VNRLRQSLARIWPWVLGCVLLFVILMFWFRIPLINGGKQVLELLTDRARIQGFVASFGTGAPLVFMSIQVLQVIFAPLPGEITGFVGGFLFGAYAGCFYSTIALGIGSWLNFVIGRYLGKRWVRRVVPKEKMEKYDYLIRHQGLLVVLMFFLFPGFPKDYLCLCLGVSTIPMRVFLPMATLGRIPGTLMLSLQGALVFEKDYLVFSLVLAANIVAVFFVYRHREALYAWIEKINGQSSQTIDDKP